MAGARGDNPLTTSCLLYNALDASKRGENIFFCFHPPYTFGYIGEGGGVTSITWSHGVKREAPRLASIRISLLNTLELLVAEILCAACNGGSNGGGVERRTEKKEEVEFYYYYFLGKSKNFFFPVES